MSFAPPFLLTSTGERLALAKKLGQGGEGAVFEVQGRPSDVVKLYLSPPDATKVAKLTAMAALATADLLSIAAWPKEPLRDPSGRILGFLMPRIGGHRPVFHLYAPKLRLQDFPSADWKFLIHAATNATRAFQRIHNTGAVLGDVNHGNLVVAEDATVRLIDCDSMQLRHHGTVWRCEVGVGTHQPPEMQGVDFKTTDRTVNHDNFGLAVILFQLLCAGRHPFQGRHLGPGNPPTIEEAIGSSRYAYARDTRRTLLAAPPGSLPIQALTPRLQDLFEAAFAADAVRKGRPDPAQWAAALHELAGQVRKCPTNHGHVFRSGLTSCPWCELEATTGVALFAAVFVGTPGGDAMVALWQTANHLPQPTPLGPLPPPGTLIGQPSTEALAAAANLAQSRRLALVSSGIAIVAAIAVTPVSHMVVAGLLTGGLFFLAHHLALRVTRTPFHAEKERLQTDWGNLTAQWNADSAVAALQTHRYRLAQLKAAHDALPAQRKAQLERLKRDLKDRQLQKHLDSFMLDQTKLKGVGKAKISTLQSHGIATAGDIVESQILAIPGFGPATTATLLHWRRMVEQRFRFDPTLGVPKVDKDKVEQQLAIEANKIVAEFKAVLAKASSLATAQDQRAKALLGKRAELEPKLARANADAAIARHSPWAQRWLLALAGAVLIVAALTGVARFTDVGVVSDPNRMAPISAREEHAAEQAVQPSSMVAPTPSLLVPQSSPPLAAAPAQQVPAQGALQSTPGRDRIRVLRTANVREAPGNSSLVVRTAQEGSLLFVHGRAGNWIQVGDESAWGWVHSSLLERFPP